jgi:hypothetical protein
MIPPATDISEGGMYNPFSQFPNLQVFPVVCPSKAAIVYLSVPLQMIRVFRERTSEACDVVCRWSKLIV